MESVKVPEKRCNVFGEPVRVNADRKARVEKRYRKARMNFARAKAEAAGLLGCASAERDQS